MLLLLSLSFSYFWCVCQDVLDLSRIESGKLDLEQSPFSLQQCVEQAIHLLWGLAEKKGLDLAYFVDPSIPSQLMGDCTHLQQVIVNLVSNAIKFTPKGGVRVWININKEEVKEEKANEKHKEEEKQDGDEKEMEEQRVEEQKEGQETRYQESKHTDDDNNKTSRSSTVMVHVIFSVHDTGIGIPRSAFSRLFRQFSQADSSTIRKFGGSGLGLVISKRLGQSQYTTEDRTRMRRGQGIEQCMVCRKTFDIIVCDVFIIVVIVCCCFC